MRIAKKFVLAGTAALALAGGANLALAQPLHSMTIRLPDGGLAQIQYSGNVPPSVRFVPKLAAADDYRSASPFAMLDRISAQMDRELDALMSDVAIRPPLINQNGLFDVDMRNLPQGRMQYSVVSTMAGPGRFCARSVKITRAAPGARPHVEEDTSGNCRGVGDARIGVAPLAPEHRPAPPIEARARRQHERSGTKLLNVAYQPLR